MKKKISAFLASMLLLGSIGGAAMAEGMTPGTYEAAAQGFHGDVKLSVTVDAEKITAIDILEHSETEGIGAAALPKLVEAVLVNQTIGVDSVAGATVTSEAFKAAMTDALTQAGADMDKMTAAVAASELEDVQMDADVVVVGAGGSFRGAEDGSEWPQRDPAGKDGRNRRRKRDGRFRHDGDRLQVAEGRRI